MSEQLPDVVIAGAGPVGLTAAVELARRGHTVRIVDPVTERHPFSRALGINARTLELLEDSGVTARLIDQGKRMRGARFSDDHGELFSFGFGAVNHRYAFMLALSQAKTEAILEARLRELGVTVERGVALDAFVQHSESVDVTLKANGSGEMSASRCRWLLGADGAHSTVRKGLGLTFPGSELPADWLLADIDVGDATENPIFAYANVVRSPRGFVFLLPVQRGVMRVVSDDREALAQLPLGLSVDAQDKVLWQSAFRVRYRQVSRYQVGRVFLAGDAAHIHSPLGGRGMNMGIEDACFFARCLHNDQLVHYAPWRKKVGRQTIALVRAQTRIATQHGELPGALLRHVAPWVMRLPLLQRALVERNLGLHTPYLPPELE